MSTPRRQGYLRTLGSMGLLGMVLGAGLGFSGRAPGSLEGGLALGGAAVALGAGLCVHGRAWTLALVVPSLALLVLMLSA